jgi:hypothetical protein
VALSGGIELRWRPMDITAASHSRSQLRIARLLTFFSTVWLDKNAFWGQILRLFCHHLTTTRDLFPYRGRASSHLGTNIEVYISLKISCPKVFSHHTLTVTLSQSHSYNNRHQHYKHLETSIPFALSLAIHAAHQNIIDIPYNHDGSLY